MPNTNSANKVTHAVVRMYCMGTGDCFIIKFFAGDNVRFKMMIDCGVWTGGKDRLTPFMEDLKEYVEGEVDLLVITHEHLDHVSVFETCSDVFTNNFTVKKIWMSWSENDSLSKIKRWKTEYGEKKRALALASERLEEALMRPEEREAFINGADGLAIMGARKHFAAALSNFSMLHMQGVAGQYKGMLEGMRIVKKEIANDNIEYMYPGNIIEDLPGLEGVRFYVLGPPEKWDDVETEGGGEGESYTHNKILKGEEAFAVAITGTNAAGGTDGILPFEAFYESASDNNNVRKSYDDPDCAWRTIENEWLFSAGNLALRIGTLTNNLSLVIAIEFEENRRVMLFPGDAEYGSWRTWHNISWEGIEKPEDGVHFTQDLLRRTVFYKIAHHMSHNGTAERLGLNMMEHKDLAAMGSLDYKVIPPAWKGTMPNREMLQELLRKTKGRLMIMNEKGIFYDFHDQEPIAGKIKQARSKMNVGEKAAFEDDFKKDETNGYYIDYKVKA
ncbi:hypothetical protein [Chitinophaga barathri]|nr:hypothetical protein [Chitinophaga barathri]